MRFAYDAQADALSLVLSDAEVETSRELAPDVIVSLDRGGNVVAVEILKASQKLEGQALRRIAIDLQQL